MMATAAVAGDLKQQECRKACAAINRDGARTCSIAYQECRKTCRADTKKKKSGVACTVACQEVYGACLETLAKETGTCLDKCGDD